MYSGYEMQICRVHCNAKKIRGKAKGTNGTEIEDNPGGFTSAEHIRAASGGDG